MQPYPSFMSPLTGYPEDHFNDYHSSEIADMIDPSLLPDQGLPPHMTQYQSRAPGPSSFEQVASSSGQSFNHFSDRNLSTLGQPLYNLDNRSVDPMHFPAPTGYPLSQQLLTQQPLMRTSSPVTNGTQMHHTVSPSQLFNNTNQGSSRPSPPITKPSAPVKPSTTSTTTSRPTDLSKTSAPTKPTTTTTKSSAPTKLTTTANPSAPMKPATSAKPAASATPRRVSPIPATKMAATKAPQSSRDSPDERSSFQKGAASASASSSSLQTISPHFALLKKEYLNGDSKYGLHGQFGNASPNPLDMFTSHVSPQVVGDKKVEETTTDQEDHEFSPPKMILSALELEETARKFRKAMSTSYAKAWKTHAGGLRFIAYYMKMAAEKLTTDPNGPWASALKALLELLKKIKPAVQDAGYYGFGQALVRIKKMKELEKSLRALAVEVTTAIKSTDETVPAPVQKRQAENVETDTVAKKAKISTAAPPPAPVTKVVKQVAKKSDSTDMSAFGMPSTAPKPPRKPVPVRRDPIAEMLGMVDSAAAHSQTNARATRESVPDRKVLKISTKPPKKVVFAEGDQLEQVRYIETEYGFHAQGNFNKAVAQVQHGEGNVLKRHTLEEMQDWYKPVPLDPSNTEDMSTDSPSEAVVQDEPLEPSDANVIVIEAPTVGLPQFVPYNRAYEPPSSAQASNPSPNILSVGSPLQPTGPSTGPTTSTPNLSTILSHLQKGNVGGNTGAVGSPHGSQSGSTPVTAATAPAPQPPQQAPLFDFNIDKLSHLLGSVHPRPAAPPQVPSMASAPNAYPSHQSPQPPFAQPGAGGMMPVSYPPGGPPQPMHFPPHLPSAMQPPSGFPSHMNMGSFGNMGHQMPPPQQQQQQHANHYMQQQQPDPSRQFNSDNGWGGPVNQQIPFNHNTNHNTTPPNTRRKRGGKKHAASKKCWHLTSKGRCDRPDCKFEH